MYCASSLVSTDRGIRGHPLFTGPPVISTEKTLQFLLSFLESCNGDSPPCDFDFARC